MAVRIGDVIITQLASTEEAGGAKGEERASAEMLSGIRNMVQQASARLEALALEAKSRPKDVAQIDNLKSKIGKAKQQVAAHRGQLIQQKSPLVDVTLPSMAKSYRIGDLLVTLIPSRIHSAEGPCSPCGGPPPPPHSGGPCNPLERLEEEVAQLEVEEGVLIQVELDTVSALLVQAALLLAGPAGMSVGLPQSASEAQSLEMKLGTAQEKLDAMKAQFD
jgi:hypothetical protein